jgi:hypothetical protein
LLIEESRANLALQSEDFATSWSVSNLTVGSDAVVGPSGTQIADSLTATSSTGILFQSVTKAASATTYTVSFYLKSTLNGNVTIALDDGTSTNRGRYLFNLSTGVATGVFNDGTFTNTSGTITAAGNGWYRITCTTTTNTTTTVRIRLFFGPSSSVVYAWGAQLELGAFATSYIPTVASQVTRAADVAVMTGANFSNWYTTADKTLYVEHIPSQVSVYRNVLQIDDGTNSNRISFALLTGATGQMRYDVSSGGVTSINTFPSGSGNSFAANTIVKAAFAMSIGSTAPSNSLNGGAAVGATGSQFTAPTVEPAGTLALRIGHRNAANAFINGHIRRLAFFPRRLADSELQGITS